MKCRKGCCWTPYGICAKKHACACHMSPEDWEIYSEMSAMGVDEDEVRRRRALRALKETKRKKDGWSKWAP